MAIQNSHRSNILIFKFILGALFYTLQKRIQRCDMLRERDDNHTEKCCQLYKRNWWVPMQNYVCRDREGLYFKSGILSKMVRSSVRKNWNKNNNNFKIINKFVQCHSFVYTGNNSTCVLYGDQMDGWHNHEEWVKRTSKAQCQGTRPLCIVVYPRQALTQSHHNARYGQLID